MHPLSLPLSPPSDKSINANDVAVNCLNNIKEQDIKTGIIDVDSSVLLMRQSFTLISNDLYKYYRKKEKCLCMPSYFLIGTYCISAKNINKRQDHRPMLMDLEFDSLQQYPDNIQLLSHLPRKQLSY